MKFTPGPWEIHDGGETICAMTGESTCQILAEMNLIPEAPANARLMAAAPDLFEVLKIAREVMRWDADVEKGIVDLVLEKVEGK